LPTHWRAVVFGGAWLPFFALTVFNLPQYDRIFTKLQEKGELPALTSTLMWFSRLSQASFGLSVLVCFALLMLVDVRIARLTARMGRRAGVFYGTWFAAVIVGGLLAVLVVIAALLLPVFKMGSTVG
jgi:type II secretory pathway component PulF